MTSQAPQLNENVLEDRFLHKVFLFFHLPASWPTPLNWLLLMASFGLHFGLWWLIWPVLAPTMSVIHMVFVLGDLFLLWQLPRRHISFGPIASQLFVMLVPRWGVSLVALGLAWFHPVFGLGAMFVLHLFGTLSYLWGMLIEPHDLSLTSFSLNIPHWPADSPPVRLLHLSDLHLERLTRRESYLLELVAEAQADVILISGDYLNLSYIEDPEAIEQVRAFLPKLAPHATLGVFATLGSPPVDLRHITPGHFANTSDKRVELLRNEMRLLNVGAGRQLAILGLDCTHDMPYDEYHFEQLFAQYEQSKPPETTPATVLLYHSPEAMPFVQQHPINLYLCGHTHGGQVRLPWYGALLTSSSTGKRYEMGRYDENGTTLYVSRGIGLEGMPMPRLRLLCPPEITLITLNGAGQ